MEERTKTSHGGICSREKQHLADQHHSEIFVAGTLCMGHYSPGSIFKLHSKERNLS